MFFRVALYLVLNLSWLFSKTIGLELILVSDGFIVKNYANVFFGFKRNTPKIYEIITC